jgi:hypothetical protein
MQAMDSHLFSGKKFLPSNDNMAGSESSSPRKPTDPPETRDGSDEEPDFVIKLGTRRNAASESGSEGGVDSSGSEDEEGFITGGHRRVFACSC